MITFAKIFLMEEKVRVRFAPSPTGPLHIGGVRTALYNYLFAKKNGGDFILRIEDTDQKRYVDGAEAYIISALNWLGLAFDEGPEQGGEKGPYRQSERSELYKEHIDKLLQDGNAYYAFDTPEELAKKRNENPNWTYNASARNEMRNSISLGQEVAEDLIEKGTPYVIRTKIPENKKITVSDIIRGDVVFDSSQLDDKVLIKEDRLPTYHFANIVDDHLMEISHVIRGEEWLSSAALHQLLYEFLGWTAPVWVHLPLILKPTGKGKLSKRDGELGNFPVFPLEWNDPSSEDVWKGFKEEGYFPEAIVNILALLGWNPGTEQELFSLNELIKAFSLDRINNSGARFDPEKAKWFNKEYLQVQPEKDLVDTLSKELYSRGLQKETIQTEKVVSLMKDRSHFIAEMANVEFLFNSPKEFNEKTLRKKWKEETPELLREYSHGLSQLEEFDEVSIEEHFKQFIEHKGIGMGAIMPNLRLALTGLGSGPSLYLIIEILGKNQSVDRINNSIEKMNELYRG